MYENSLETRREVHFLADQGGASNHFRRIEVDIGSYLPLRWGHHAKMIDRTERKCTFLRYYGRASYTDLEKVYFSCKYKMKIVHSHDSRLTRGSDRPPTRDNDRRGSRLARDKVRLGGNEHPGTATGAGAKSRDSTLGGARAALDGVTRNTLVRQKGTPFLSCLTGEGGLMSLGGARRLPLTTVAASATAGCLLTEV